MISTPERTELTISNLKMDDDAGTYVCNATNSQGSTRETISLRVRSRMAALWPFLGIVVEVIVLVTIIFIYEKRRKPDQTLDGEQPWIWVRGWDTLSVLTRRKVRSALSSSSSSLHHLARSCCHLGSSLPL